MEPIAKRLRQSAESALLPAGGKKRKAQAPEAEDVAARIRRLEAELQGSSGGESSSSDSDDGASEDEGGADGGGVVSLSAFADERVAALPEQLLPPRASSSAALSHSRQKKKERKDQGEEPKLPELLDVIQWPKKVPFACKPCGFVGKDMDEFSAHRESAEHLARAAQGPQALHCKLCDKTFTSPSQLSEHKAGKWHQQRLHRKKERHVVRVCYDFMRGSCRRGDQCAFEHTETKAMRRGTALDKTRRRPCDAFARSGSCKFGDKCLFGHTSA